MLWKDSPGVPYYVLIQYYLVLSTTYRQYRKLHVHGMQKYDTVLIALNNRPRVNKNTSCLNIVRQLVKPDRKRLSTTIHIKPKVHLPLTGK